VSDAVTCDVCLEEYEPCNGHRCDGGLAIMQERAETAEATAEGLRAIVEIARVVADGFNIGELSGRPERVKLRQAVCRHPASSDTLPACCTACGAELDHRGNAR
jgi:hypothetical protein